MVNMAIPYRGPDGMSAQLLAEVKRRFGARAQSLGYITGYPEAARAGQTGGHFPDVHGITHAVDIGVDVQADGTGLDTRDALWLAHHLRALGAAGKHPFSQRGYLIHDMSETTTPKPLIAGFHTGWKWVAYTGASPHSDHIHVTTGGDQQWGEASQLAPAVYNSKASWGIAAATVSPQNTVAGYTRPVPNFIGVSQHYGSNPTRDLPADHWLIRQFGNYQPNGHTGTDYNCAAGTDVYAVGPGTVLWAGPASQLPGDDSAAGWASRWYIAKGFAGNVLVINHGPFLGIYAHLGAFLVARGAKVAQGQRVALSGNTGASTGPHLHFEVVPTSFAWGNGMYGRVNPANYLSLKSVTLAPGYTGATTRTAPLSLLEQIMALDRNSADYKTLVRDIAKGVMDFRFTDQDMQYIHLGQFLSYHRRNEAKTRRIEKNTEAIAAAVNPATLQASITKALGEGGAQVNVQQLSAQIVADLIKETRA
jgi:murein DD-endopeptidase MepM/ murein hydrolase activator NlpD